MDKHARAKPTLEDYIIDMETRPPDSGRGEADKDVWAQLHQKEADLLLAAELGKALLEKNEELQKQQEKLIDDYSVKLEKLEQDKYILKRQLEITSSENDAVILELQADIKSFKEKLEAQEQVMRAMEREKNLLIEELTAQNTRLSNELKKSNAAELQLSAQLQEIKEQCNRRTLSIQDHVNSLDSLKNELRLILEKKNDLENRLHMSVNEKENLSIALNEASERIHILERSTKEQDTKYQMTVQTLDRLERENGTLSERLESFDSQRSGASSGDHANHSSLLQEMCGEDESMMMVGGGGAGGAGVPASVKDEATLLLYKEAQSVYRQLKTLCQTLRSTHHDDDSGLHSDMSFSSMDNTSSSAPQSVDAGPNAGANSMLGGGSLRPSGGGLGPNNGQDKFVRGMLSSAADELVHIIMNMDAMQFKTMFEQTRAMLIDQEDELKKKTELIRALESKISGQDIELQSAIEERNQARDDASHSSLAQDETVVQARADRDAAIERRTKAEVELAKNRVELMQANSQLLEAIQQKVELLQQLEQWQIDMHELIEEQMKNKNTESLLLAEFQKVVSEIKNLKEEQHSTRKYVSKAVGEIEKSQNFLAHKFDEVCDNIKRLENEQHTLKGSVGVVEGKYVQLSETVNRLEGEVDRYRRSALSCNAILLGIPEVKDENLGEAVTRFAAVLGLNITEDFFSDVKRLRDSKSESRSPPIRIVFASEPNKEQFFAKKKEVGQVQVSMLGGCYSGKSGRVMLRDEMTPHGLALLREVKEVQEQLDLKYVWPGRNGVILVKKTDKSKVEYIQNRNDLQKLNKLSSKRGLEMSLSGPISSSSVIEQDPKRR